ncbi:hypothetical protein [Escherichia coli]|uniref:hypothetical protein n=1 Tax=Escherichia coli TaxID=562 RepID=UPI001F4E2814|nr:hypothetical protein [Escherichia coli]MCH9308630.1 hypothetical protein [Escherichia coli]
MKPSYEELEKKLAESQREFRAADATIENLQMQVDKLRTANAGLCAVLTNANACYKAAVFEGLMEALEESSGTNLADIVTRRLLYIPEPITSDVTDAFLAEVRAAAVDEVCLKISNAIINCYQDEQIGLDAAAAICGDFASGLRKGVQS